MLKPGLGILIVGLVLLRLSYWNESVKLSESICAGLLSSNRYSQNTKFLRVKGSLNESYTDQIELRNLEVFWQKEWRSIEGRVKLPSHLKLMNSPQRTIEWAGEFNCHPPLRNFSSKEDGLFQAQGRSVLNSKGEGKLIPIFQPFVWNFHWGDYFRSYLKTLLFSFPNLRGIIWAVWTGETVGLDPRLVELYRNGGLLPLIALSGQHVSCFSVLIRYLFYLAPNRLIERLGFRRYYRKFLVLLPVVGSLILSLTSYGSPSVVRTLSMGLALTFLRLSRKFCSPGQLLSSSAALLLVLDPNLLRGISFVLSFNGTLLLIATSEFGWCGTPFKSYLLLSSVMAVLSAPLILFYFGHWSYLAPFCTILLSWMWSLVIIPVGFIVPFLGWLPEAVLNPVLHWLDSGWQNLVQSQLVFESLIAKSHRVYMRTTLTETFLFQIAVLFLVKKLYGYTLRSNAARSL